MIPKVPQLITTTDLRKNLDAALDMATKDPVYILRHSQIVAVMISHRAWENIQEDLAEIEEQRKHFEELRAAVAKKVAAEMASKDPE